jgi:hypothetical protein
MQYMEPGLPGMLVLGAFNSIAVAAAAFATVLFPKKHLWAIPVGAGYGFVALMHGTLDLSSDAQAAVALVFIPVYSVFFFVIGGGFAFMIQAGLTDEPKP